MDIDDYILENSDSEECYEVSRFEVRVAGKKPLVITNPTFADLERVTALYLNLAKPLVRQLLQAAIIDTPEPLTLSEHNRLVQYLESTC